jgi:superfamily II DNA or RNA helicase
MQQEIAITKEGLAPRQYQEEAIAAVHEAYDERGVERQLVVLPTGTGKTIVFGRVARGGGRRSA